ncbi:hypothetical protein ABW20_dc0102782 [Dactylellina cionopaga]|nr:hypothetical protein ABW20_dc0102782 [Dactylellina cionopaga]
MTRPPRQSVERDRIKAEEMAPPTSPPPPPAATTAAAAAAAPPTTVPIAQSQVDVSGEEDPITIHKRVRSPLFGKVFDKALKSSLSGVTPESWNKCFPTPMAKRPEQMKELSRKFCEIYELNVRKNFDEIVASRKLLASLDNLDILISEAQTRRTRFYEANPQPPLPMAPPPKPNSSDTEVVAATAPEPKPSVDTPMEPESEPKAVAMASSTEKEPEKAPEPNIPQPPPPLYDFNPQDLYISHLYPFLQLQSDRLESLKSQQQSSIDGLIQRREDQQKEIQQLIATLEKRLSVVDDAAEGVKEILEMDGDDDDMVEA